MYYKNLFFLITIFFINNCSVDLNNSNKIKHQIDKKFLNKGFTLIYDEILIENKTLSKKIDDRSLIIFQNKLKKNSTVKVVNLINKKALIAKVGANSTYPNFYNSVVSRRIAEELEINPNNPYIEISLITENSSFVAKKVKMFNEEKNVADKAPIDGIKISDLTNNTNKTKKVKKENISYYIKIADFYYNKSALAMVDRIKNETLINDIKIKELSKTNYRVFLGPFNDISLLKEFFNKINVLEFENLEIIKND
jgi:hypothetical protein